MKHWNRRKPIKALCFILTVPLLAAILLGIVCITYLWKGEVYYHEKDVLLQGNIQQQFQTDSYLILSNSLWAINEGKIPQLADKWTNPKKTNLRFEIVDPEGNTVYSTKDNITQGQTLTQHMVVAWREQADEYMEGLHYEGFWGQDWSDAQQVAGCYKVYGYVVSDLPAWDDYRLSIQVIEAGYALRYAIYYIVAACAALLIFCFVNLTVTAGRRPGTQELHPGRWDKLPTDVLVILSVSVLGVWFPIWQELTWSISDTFAMILLWASIVAMAYGLLGLWLCLASRFKRRQLLKNTLVYKVCASVWNGGKSIIKALPMVWKTALAAGGVLFWSFLIIVEILQRFSAISSRAGLAIVMILLQALAVALLLIWTALQLRRLQAAGQALAEGNLDQKLDTTGLYGELKAHGENLNSIGSGMAKAVSRQMQSERMKTELVTNVSHDIKNPLTSIISYSELICQEDCDNPKHKEYAQVLERKSQHLKRLLEDLVEASRAATGDLDIALEPCRAEVLLEQVAGEFAERCENAGLTLVVKSPDESLHLTLDSRRIWRVFENLMSNACKYSLQGSRVYLSLQKQADQAVFAIRNTSQEPLDIPPEELIERFVRGDSARSTEGSGLGLSIAQSLVAAQGGQMDVGIDGDLFKVTLRFGLTEA